MSKEQIPAVTSEAVLNALQLVQDPDLKQDIVSLGMIRDLEIADGSVSFRFVLTTPACPVREELEDQARKAVESLPGVTEVNVTMDASVPKHRGVPDRKSVDGVSHIVAVTSGKGGVGKSTVAVNLACALSAMGAKVGLLDCDIYGPNVPIMLGLDAKPESEGNRLVPVKAFGLEVMSMGFLAEGDTPLIWRGPMLHGVIQQFLYQVAWGELDYLVADLPPGTGDVQLSMMQSVPLTGGIVVTTPQDVALSDARKGIMMFKQVEVEVLGLVENMSYFVCPKCEERTEIFSHGGGEKTSQQYRVPFLGKIPLETSVREGGDQGQPIVIGNDDNPASQAFQEIAKHLAARISTVSFGQDTVELEA